MPILPPNAKRVFKGEIFDVYQWKQQMYDGTTKIFESIKRSATVIVIPVTENGNILVLNQEQPHRDKPYLSLVSGRVEENEYPKKAAVRELLEETGYTFSEMTLFDKHNPFVKMDWTIYTYIATGCKKIAKQNLDPGEKIEVKLINFDAFIEILAQRKVSDVDLTIKALEAKLDSEKMEKLKKLLAN